MDRHRSQNKPLSQVSGTTDVPPAQKLLIKYLVRLNRQTDQVEIQRGDVVLAQDDVEAGVVAAVMVDCHCRKATHFLLGSLPPTTVYHLVPLTLIDRIEEKKIWLTITGEGVYDLPEHQPVD